MTSELTRFVALLRGINVGGHRVKMERLRQVFTDLGLRNVRSYINSGNLFFDTESADVAGLTASIERALLEALGYEVPTFLRTPEQLQSILVSDPFAGIELTDELRFCVVFTAEAINRDLELPFSSPNGGMDIVAVNEHEAFVIWRLKGGRPPSGSFPAGVLPARNTTRFFHTLKKIQAAASAN